MVKKDSMVKHIVMWKLHEFADGHTKAENALRIKKALEALKDKIGAIASLEVGINHTSRECAYDVVLYSEFNSFDDLDAYQNHEAHIALKGFLKDLRAGRVFVDYEV